ncbi:MAG: FAD-binding oxidoreductase [Acidimicrobiaceae bacterium]|nr:FAD-binding oxidoreductase [Acidimicrobiaceae bacterium]
MLLELDKVAVSPASADDAVGGVQPDFVARPTSTEEVSTVLAAARERNLAVVPRGAGTTLAWGAPPCRADLVVDLTGLTGVVEHVAGDLVVVVRAGTRLTDLQAALAGSGQRLGIDGDHGSATIGGLVAHGLAGPSRLAYGTLRDLLIGATFVRADGVAARTGGKVVKNVAGYDLGKLLHGSWGTVAVLTELVFRLHPLPEATRWVTVRPGSGEAAGTLARRVLHSQLVPAALELDRPAGGPLTVSILLEGRAATVAERATALAELAGDADITDIAPPWWGRRPAGQAGSDAVLLRLTTEVASLPRLLAGVEDAALATGLSVDLRGSAGAGSLLAAVRGGSGGPADASCLIELVGRLRRYAGGLGGTVVVLDGPPGSIGDVDRWGPVPGLDLMRRIKAQFDPERILSPGRFVGGI